MLSPRAVVGRICGKMSATDPRRPVTFFKQGISDSVISMRGPYKILLLIEVLICFGPMTVMLLIGVLLIPIQIFALIDEPLLWDGPVYVLGSVTFGGCGLGALAYTLGQLFSPNGAIKRPAIVLGCTMLGALPLLIWVIPTSDGIGWRILAAMPMVCAAHIVYMARGMLFPRLAD